jgi:hypothetical protein
MENPKKGKFHPVIENLRKNNHPQGDRSTFQIMFGQMENPSIGFFEQNFHWIYKCGQRGISSNR